MNAIYKGFSRAIMVDAENIHLAEIRRFVEGIAFEAALDRERVFDLKVAVSEACANVVEHAGCGTTPLEVCAEVQSGRLTFTIRDSGCFHPPSRVRDGDMFCSRGLGLPLMVALMDEVSFTRLPDGGTCVSLTVLLPA